MLIGEGHYALEALANLIDNPATVNLISSTFEVHGKLDLNIIPVNPDGSEDLDFIPNEPSELID
jgi:phage gp46-like protein